MTDFARIRNTIITNPNGVMDAVLSFGAQSKIKSNVKLYFYLYNIYDLVEVSYIDDLICVYDFSHTKDRADKIKEKLEFYSGYFYTAGLHGKRFLFDLTTGIPVSYSDFAELDNLPCINNREFAFVLDKKIGYVYGEGQVYIFTASERTDIIDKCIMSFFNNCVKVANPKSFELAGCEASIIISGLLSKVMPKDIENQLDVIDTNYKFVGTINSLDYNSKFVNDIKSKLKIDKFKRILEKAKPDELQVMDKVVLKGEVSLREIIDEGLDKFIKKLKPLEVYKVIIDTEYQTIRSAYIVKGAMFITPVTIIPINRFKELLNSDNVEYILN